MPDADHLLTIVSINKSVTKVGLHLGISEAIDAHPKNPIAGEAVKYNAIGKAADVSGVVTVGVEAAIGKNLVIIVVDGIPISIGSVVGDHMSIALVEGHDDVIKIAIAVDGNVLAGNTMSNKLVEAVIEMSLIVVTDACAKKNPLLAHDHMTKKPGGKTTHG